MANFCLADLSQVITSCGGTDASADISETSLDTQLSDLGLDSLTIYEMATRLQDDYGIRITDAQIDTLDTPRAVVDLVNSELAQQT
jgi:act minimal PKS acyl carrier protein